MKFNITVDCTYLPSMERSIKSYEKLIKIGYKFEEGFCGHLYFKNNKVEVEINTLEELLWFVNNFNYIQIKKNNIRLFIDSYE